jgi:hypothetical protein
MKKSPRRSTPKVRAGRVQRKNRSAETPSYYNTPQDLPVVDRRKPGIGYRHVLKKQDIITFISILPDWNELSKGLNAIVLAPGEFNCQGWCDRGVVAVCAWERDLWGEVQSYWYQEHQDILERMEVPCQETDEGYYLLKWTEASVRAFQLLHVLLHELGHHHDRMTTRSRRAASRGERYAEQYARNYETLIWDRYVQVFSLY